MTEPQLIAILGHPQDVARAKDGGITRRTHYRSALRHITTVVFLAIVYNIVAAIICSCVIDVTQGDPYGKRVFIIVSQPEQWPPVEATCIYFSVPGASRVLLWEGPLARDPMARSVRQISIGELIPPWLDVSAIEAERSRLTVVDGRGWPFVSFTSRITFQLDTSQSTSDWPILRNESAIVNHGIPLAMLAGGTGTDAHNGRWIPTRPEWSGLAMNSAIVASIYTVILVVGTAVRAIVRARRVSSGCCANCGYQLKNGARCSECGTDSVPARSWVNGPS